MEYSSLKRRQFGFRCRIADYQYAVSPALPGGGIEGSRVNASAGSHGDFVDCSGNVG
jgi:hypothetical protein